MADYDEAIRIDPAFALAYNNRGDAWVGKGDARPCPGRFQRRHQIRSRRWRSPMAIAATSTIASATWRARSRTTAMQIKLRPDVLAYINRGNAWRDSEQLDRAAADYAEVIRLAPTDARGWRNRGMIRLYTGRQQGRPRRLRQGGAIRSGRRVSPGTTAVRRNCGSATRRARSRISGRRWSCARTFRRRARACGSSARRRSGSVGSRLAADRHNQGACRSRPSRTGTARSPSGHRPAPGRARPGSVSSRCPCRRVPAGTSVWTKVMTPPASS